MSGRSDEADLRFREGIAHQVFEHCGGDPKEAMGLMLGVAIGILLAAYDGNRVAAGHHFSILSKGIVEELTGDGPDVVMVRVH